MAWLVARGVPGAGALRALAGRFGGDSERVVVVREQALELLRLEEDGAPTLITSAPTYAPVADADVLRATDGGGLDSLVVAVAPARLCCVRVGERFEPAGHVDLPQAALLAPGYRVRAHASGRVVAVAALEGGVQMVWVGDGRAPRVGPADSWRGSVLLDCAFTEADPSRPTLLVALAARGARAFALRIVSFALDESRDAPLATASLALAPSSPLAGCHALLAPLGPAVALCSESGVWLVDIDSAAATAAVAPAPAAKSLVTAAARAGDATLLLVAEDGELLALRRGDAAATRVGALRPSRVFAAARVAAGEWRLLAVGDLCDDAVATLRDAPLALDGRATLPALAPLADAVACDPLGEGEPQLVTCCASRVDPGLRVVRRGLATRAVSSSPPDLARDCVELFALGDGGDGHHTLVFSFAASTRVLRRVGGDLADVSDESRLDLAAPTRACGLLAPGRVCQVTPMRVRLTAPLCEWPDAGAPVAIAAAAVGGGVVALVARGGAGEDTLVVLRAGADGGGGLERVGAHVLRDSASCVAVTRAGDAAVVAVASYASRLLLFALAGDGTLRAAGDVSLSELSGEDVAVAESLVLASRGRSLHIAAGLRDGLLLQAELRGLGEGAVAVSERAARRLGALRVRLTPLREGNASRLLALSSRLWLVEPRRVLALCAPAAVGVVGAAAPFCSGGDGVAAVGADGALHVLEVCAPAARTPPLVVDRFGAALPGGRVPLRVAVEAASGALAVGCDAPASVALVDAASGALLGAPLPLPEGQVVLAIEAWLREAALLCVGIGNARAPTTAPGALLLLEALREDGGLRLAERAHLTLSDGGAAAVAALSTELLAVATGRDVALVRVGVRGGAVVVARASCDSPVCSLSALSPMPAATLACAEQRWGVRIFAVRSVGGDGGEVEWRLTHRTRWPRLSNHLAALREGRLLLVDKVGAVAELRVAASEPAEGRVDDLDTAATFALGEGAARARGWRGGGGGGGDGDSEGVFVCASGGAVQWLRRLAPAESVALLALQAAIDAAGLGEGVAGFAAAHLRSAAGASSPVVEAAEVAALAALPQPRRAALAAAAGLPLDACERIVQAVSWAD